jgi:hypothetical protein
MKIKLSKKLMTIESILKQNGENIEEVAQNFAESYKNYKLKELELNILRDKLSLEMKNKPEKWNLEKGERITDALVNRIIIRNKTYQKMYEDYLKLKEERLFLEGKLEAEKVKSYSLIELFKLQQKEEYHGN